MLAVRLCHESQIFINKQLTKTLMRRKIIENELYFTFPILCIIGLYCIVSVCVNDANILVWSKLSLKYFIYFSFPAIILGLFLAYEKYDERKRRNTKSENQEKSINSEDSDWNEFYNDRRIVNKTAKFRMSDDGKLERID